MRKKEKPAALLSEAFRDNTWEKGVCKKHQRKSVRSSVLLLVKVRARILKRIGLRS